MKFSYLVGHFKEEPMERGIERLRRYGYDGVEIRGEPETTDVKKIKGYVQQHGISVSSISCQFPKGSRRDLISPEPETHRAAADYFRCLIDMACELDAGVVIFNPSAGFKVEPKASPQEEWKWAVERIRECAEYAARASDSLKLVIEPWNGYETYLINRLDEALKLKQAVGMDNIGVMADFFHMNIEESSMEEAMRRCGEDLMHTHVVDSNRATPGKGHLNFRSLLRVLKEIGYDRYLAMGDSALKPEAIWGHVASNKEELYEAYAREAIGFMRHTLAGIEK